MENLTTKDVLKIKKMRLSEIVARGNTIIGGLNKFCGMRFSEKTKYLITQHIESELLKFPKFDNNLLEFIKYDITETFGKHAINSHNLFTALIFNGLYYPEAVNYNDTFQLDWGTFRLLNDVLYLEQHPIEKVRELRLNKILND